MGTARRLLADVRGVHGSRLTATDTEGNVVGEADPYEQTRRALTNVETAPSRAGASLDHVVGTRLFVTDVDDWEAVGDARVTGFGKGRPATSPVEVFDLVNPAMLVEIEATAIVSDRSDPPDSA